jgi:hypothetical protein
MRRVLASFVLVGALACGQSTTSSTAQSTEGSADVAAGQEAAEQIAEKATEAVEAAGSEVEKLEEEQTEE